MNESNDINSSASCSRCGQVRSVAGTGPDPGYVQLRAVPYHRCIAADPADRGPGDGWSLDGFTVSTSEMLDMKYDAFWYARAELGELNDAASDFAVARVHSAAIDENIPCLPADVESAVEELTAYIFDVIGEIGGLYNRRDAMSDEIGYHLAEGGVPEGADISGIRYWSVNPTDPDGRYDVEIEGQSIAHRRGGMSTSDNIARQIERALLMALADHGYRWTSTGLGPIAHEGSRDLDAA